MKHYHSNSPDHPVKFKADLIVFGNEAKDESISHKQGDELMTLIKIKK